MADDAPSLTAPVTDTIELHRDMTQAYMGYARETITDRALPDVRDGLKPVQRRILYAMYDLGLTHDKPYKKSARIVGEVLGKYHPHGDISVYLSMVRMAQDFAMEAPLVDGQGNYGSIDGDAPAAMRYTEARLTALAETMLQDLDMDTVPWTDNFDASLKEPVVLPTVFPNLLVNGADGIAVGMATKIPPHNLGEVCDAVVYVSQNWRRRAEIGVDELLPIIPGPDFPTGGLIYRYRHDETDGQIIDTIRDAYLTGRGRVVMQARVLLEDIGGGKANIIVNELPYAVLKTTVIEKLAKEVRDGRISGITDLRDESDYTGMRVVIEVSRTADAKEVLQDVLKYSQLRETFGVINLALVAADNHRMRPQYLSLADMLVHFVQHRLVVIERRSRFELEKRKARLHIVDGLLKALDILDEVIETIRRSQTAETARTNLMRKFEFSEIQATAILDMQLRRLAALERRKLADERLELLERIRYLEELLSSEAKRLLVVVEETQSLKKRFAIPRRTVIIDQEESAAGNGTITTQADLVVPDAAQVIILTPGGLERKDAKGFSYKVSDGLSSRAVPGGGHLAHLTAEPNEHVILFSSRGRAWKANVGFVPAQAGPPELGMEAGERLVSAAILRPGQFLVMATQSGKVKRTKVEDLAMPDRIWDVVIGLAEDDVVLFADVAPAGAHVLFCTLQGQLLRIEGDSVNPQQTGSATGVSGIKLREDDQLFAGAVVAQATQREADTQVVVVSSIGYVHRSALSVYPVQGRGATGVRCLSSSRYTALMGGLAVGQGKNVDVFLEDGRRQRLSVEDIPVGGRDARGAQLVQDPKKVPVTWATILD